MTISESLVTMAGVGIVDIAIALAAVESVRGGHVKRAALRLVAATLFAVGVTWLTAFSWTDAQWATALFVPFYALFVIAVGLVLGALSLVRRARL